MLLHQLDDLDQLRMAHAKPRRERHALVVLLIADTFMDELLGDRRREFMTMLPPDQVQHHIKRRRATRAGEAVAVDLEQLIRNLDTGEFLDEAGDVLPVNRTAVAFE